MLVDFMTFGKTESRSASNAQQFSQGGVEEYDYEALPENTPMAISMAAGALAGMMEHTVMYPVDAIKTRMQVAASAGNIYRGLLASLNRISSSEGGLALWRGITSMALGAGPAHAVHYAVYETVSSLGSSGNPISSAGAGFCASVSSEALMNPFDVVKQRMQLQAKNSGSCRGVWATARQIYGNEGFRAFYVSYPTTLIMSIPFAATNFTCYDQLTHLFNRNRKYDPLTHCIAGGVAGATAAAVSTPFDVVKTLLQTRGCSDIREARELKGIRDASMYIYRRAGLGGFLLGIRPRMVANIPSTAISWTVYEFAKHTISRGELS